MLSTNGCAWLFCVRMLGVYPDRPPSPGRTGPVREAKAASSAGSASANGSAKSAAYRPPIARGNSGSVAAMMRADREKDTVGPGKVPLHSMNIHMYQQCFKRASVMHGGYAMLSDHIVRAALRLGPTLSSAF